MQLSILGLLPLVAFYCALREWGNSFSRMKKRHFYRIILSAACCRLEWKRSSKKKQGTLNLWRWLAKFYNRSVVARAEKWSKTKIQTQHAQSSFEVMSSGCGLLFSSLQGRWTLINCCLFLSAKNWRKTASVVWPVVFRAEISASSVDCLILHVSTMIAENCAFFLELVTHL